MRIMPRCRGGRRRMQVMPRCNLVCSKTYMISVIDGDVIRISKLFAIGKLQTGKQTSTHGVNRHRSTLDIGNNDSIMKSYFIKVFLNTIINDVRISIMATNRLLPSTQIPRHHPNIPPPNSLLMQPSLLNNATTRPQLKAKSPLL